MSKTNYLLLSGTQSILHILAFRQVELPSYF